MIPGNGNGYAEAAQLKKVAQTQHLAGAENAYHEIHFFPQRGDNRKDLLPVVTVRNHFYPIFGRIRADLVPQIDEKISGIQKRRAQANRFDSLLLDGPCFFYCFFRLADKIFCGFIEIGPCRGKLYALIGSFFLPYPQSTHTPGARPGGRRR